MSLVKPTKVSDFQLASGGVVGRDHRTASRNYQDASYVASDSDRTIGLVTDGCGSGKFSEVGANLGVRLLADSLLACPPGTLNLAQVQQHLLSGIDVLARQMGGNYRRTIEDYFLFTIVGVMLQGDTATFFALGDGVIIVNGAVMNLGPFPGNMPPYAGYGLLAGQLQIDPALVSLKTVLTIPLAHVEHFALGSDGIEELISSEDEPLPGLTENCGPISQFWEEDRYFGANHELLSRRLKLIARDWPKRDPCPGLLADDTTLIVGRRKPASEVPVSPLIASS